MMSSSLSSLSRQQLLSGYRNLHAKDVTPDPEGVSFNRSHGTPFDFEGTLDRFQGQDSQALLSEATVEAQKSEKSGHKHVWKGIPSLLAGFAGLLGGPVGIAFISLPAFIFGAQQLFKGTSELKTASDNRQFIQDVQFLSDPMAERQARVAPTT